MKVSSSTVILKALLEKSPPLKRSNLLFHLAEESLANIQSILLNGLYDPTVGLSLYGQRLQTIHSSWIAPFLRTLPERDIFLFLSCLSKGHQEEIKQALKLSSSPSFVLQKKATFFLQKTLWNELHKDFPSLLPKECLPPTDAWPLLSLSLSEIYSLVFYLGLHDVAVEIKNIVETARLKKIQAALSGPEKQYLHILLQSKEPVPFPPMKLQLWNGDASLLHSLIRQRGLNRFAKGLYGQDKSFVWYVIHMLDSHTAHLFQKVHTSLDNKEAARSLFSQILEILSFMRKPL